MIPLILFEYTYVFFLWKPEGYFWFFFLSPFNVVLALYLLQFSALLISFLLITICNLRYHPKEGTFKRDIEDKAYRYWTLRNIIKKWPLYITATHPFPWLKNRFSLRFFGVKIGKKGLCDNAWISSEFVEIGKDVIIGMGTTILSFGIEQNKFIIDKISIKNGVSIGAKCVLLPGTKIGENVKLNAHSYTSYDQQLLENKIYKGRLAKIKED
jgi:hypothetical protein